MNKTKTTFLTKQEEQELVKRAQSGDIDARNRLVESNMGLIVAEASKLIKKYGIRTSAISFEDVINESVLGFIKGIEKFDPEKGYRLSTYAIWWVKQTARKFLIMNMPTGVVSLRTREKALRDRESELYAMTMKEGIDINDEENPIDIPDEKNIPNEDEVERENVKKIIKDALKRLSEKKSGIFKDPDFCYEILSARFGLETGIPMSLREVGEIFGVSYEYIRQCENEILKTLRRKKEIAKIEGGLE